jgi:hypothetical protein
MKFRPDDGRNFLGRNMSVKDSFVTACKNHTRANTRACKRCKTQSPRHLTDPPAGSTLLYCSAKLRNCCEANWSYPERWDQKRRFFREIGTASRAIAYRRFGVRSCFFCFHIQEFWFRQIILCAVDHLDGSTVFVGRASYVNERTQRMCRKLLLFWGLAKREFMWQTGHCWWRRVWGSVTLSWQCHWYQQE